MDEKILQEMALFKFSLIAPVINDIYDAPSKAQFFRELAQREHLLPNGKSEHFAADTFKSWYLDYKHGGFDALMPKLRDDKGRPRALTEDAIARIHEIKEKLPYITGTLIYHKLIEEGTIKQSKTSLSTVLRYIRDNDLKRSQLIPVDRRAFEMPFANDCWQADSSHGPIITVNGTKKKAYLIAFIDDASRLLVHGQFYFNDTALNMQDAFKKAIAKYGVPKKLFVDNGSSYRNEQLGYICASLGIVLIHSKPYTPQGKGKIERSFRTVKDGWMNGIDWTTFSSLEKLNEDYWGYLNRYYNNAHHSSIDSTPRDRYLKDATLIKHLPSDLLNHHFLHRMERRVNSDATVIIDKKPYEVPMQYIGKKVKIRYLPSQPGEAYIFSEDHRLLETIHLVNKVDNAKIKRKKCIDFSDANEE
ncbi:MAG: DDE-type integrase/transposase/recombinase [Niameybacter sp.]